MTKLGESMHKVFSFSLWQYEQVLLPLTKKKHIYPSYNI